MANSYQAGDLFETRSDQVHYIVDLVRTWYLFGSSHSGMRYCFFSFVHYLYTTSKTNSTLWPDKLEPKLLEPLAT